MALSKVVGVNDLLGFATLGPVVAIFAHCHIEVLLVFAHVFATGWAFPLHSAFRHALE